MCLAKSQTLKLKINSHIVLGIKLHLKHKFPIFTEKFKKCAVTPRKFNHFLDFPTLLFKIAHWNCTIKHIWRNGKAWYSDSMLIGNEKCYTRFIMISKSLSRNACFCLKTEFSNNFYLINFTILKGIKLLWISF